MKVSYVDAMAAVVLLSVGSVRGLPQDPAHTLRPAILIDSCADTAERSILEVPIDSDGGDIGPGYQCASPLLGLTFNSYWCTGRAANIAFRDLDQVRIPRYHGTV